MAKYENIKTVIKSRIISKQKTWFRDGTTVTKWFDQDTGKAKQQHIGFSPISARKGKV